MIVSEGFGLLYAQLGCPKYIIQHDLSFFLPTKVQHILPEHQQIQIFFNLFSQLFFLSVYPQGYNHQPFVFRPLTHSSHFVPSSLRHPSKSLRHFVTLSLLNRACPLHPAPACIGFSFPGSGFPL